MLTTDAFLGGAGETDRLRMDSPLPSASAGKAARNAEAEASGDSFAEALESAQSAMDDAGVSGTAAEAADEGGAANAVALAGDKGGGKPPVGPLSRKGAAEGESEPAQGDALYARLSGEAALEAAIISAGAQPAPQADADQLDAAGDASFSPIIIAIASDSLDSAAGAQSIAREDGAASLEPPSLDGRGRADMKAEGGELPAGAGESLGASLPSTNEGAAGIGGSADGSGGAFAAPASLAHSVAGMAEGESLAAKGAEAALLGQGAPDGAAGEEAAFAVADFRGGPRPNAERDAARAAAGPAAEGSGAILASADSLAADASLEGDSLLGREGLGSGGGFRSMASDRGRGRQARPRRLRARPLPKGLRRSCGAPRPTLSARGKLCLGAAGRGQSALPCTQKRSAR